MRRCRGYSTRPNDGSFRRLRFIILAMFAVALGAIVPVAPAAAATGDSYLMVSDGAASTVYFYKLPGMTPTGQVTGVKLGARTGAPAGADPAANNPAHAGVIVLPDGRIIVNDESAQKTLAIKLNAAGVPSVVNSVTSRLGDEAPWSSVDAGFRYYAVASNGAGPGLEVLNLIDLKTFKNTQVEIPMAGAAEDLTPFFGANPLTVFAGVGGGVVRAYNVAALLAGNSTPTGTFGVGPNSHGGFSSPSTGTIGITTGPQPPNLGAGGAQVPNPDNLGMDIFDVSCTPAALCRPPVSLFPERVPPFPCVGIICPTLVNRTTVPWNADGLTLSKGNRVRGHV